MARARTVWGIDIGQCALKALKLRDVQGQLEVEEFEVIPHPQILSGPDVDRDQLIQDAIARFLAGHNVAGTHVAISVPGQASFSRFVKLPPVETKRIPEIVRFEAEQQIPFPINEVIWRYQTFRDPDSPDVEVGIFAMKKSDVAEMLNHFNLASLRVDTVQVAPLALYNYMSYDGQAEEGGATILADVGADKTDLVIADKGRVWTRTIQIGGNKFTEALVRTFKLSFEKAEELKLSAASSKYARQIFQAMRPVFADLVQEIQRSIGFYTSLHRDTRFTKLVGLGNGFRLPGLQKFMEQNLNVTVMRVDTFGKLVLGSSVNAPSFHEAVPSLAVAYGLGVQGMGQEEISTNLLPSEIVRFRLWKKKRPYFVAAAVVLLAAMFLPGYRANQDAMALQGRTQLNQAKAVIDEINGTVGKWQGLSGKDTAQESAITQRAELLGYRNVWPSLMTMVEQSVRSVTPDQPLLLDYARLQKYRQYVPVTVQDIIRTGQGLDDPNQIDKAASILLSVEELGQLKGEISRSAPEALKSRAAKLLKQIPVDANSGAIDANSVVQMTGDDLKRQVVRLELLNCIRKADAFKDKPRSQRRVIVVEGMDAVYFKDIGSAMPSEGGAGGVKTMRGKPGFKITLKARTPLELQNANIMVANLGKFSREYAKWFSAFDMVNYQVQWVTAPAAPGGLRTVVAPSPTGVTPKKGDPLMDEESTGDTVFRMIWFVEIISDGVVLNNVRLGEKYTLGVEAEMFPNFEPTDVMADAKKIFKLSAQTQLTVKEVKMKSTVPWYRVSASDAGGKSLGEGWVPGADVKGQMKSASRAQ